MALKASGFVSSYTTMKAQPGNTHLGTGGLYTVNGADIRPLMDTSDFDLTRITPIPLVPEITRLSPCEGWLGATFLF